MHSWQSDSFSVQLFGNEIVFFVSLIFSVKVLKNYFHLKV